MSNKTQYSLNAVEKYVNNEYIEYISTNPIKSDLGSHCK